jgi:hypothetical protein
MTFIRKWTSFICFNILSLIANDRSKQRHSLDPLCLLRSASFPSTYSHKKATPPFTMPLKQLLVPVRSSSRHDTKKMVTVRSIVVWPLFGALFGFLFTIINVQRPCFLGEVGAYLEDIPDYPNPPPPLPPVPPPLYDGICDPVSCIEFFLFLAFSLLPSRMLLLFLCDFKLTKHFIL